MCTTAPFVQCTSCAIAWTRLAFQEKQNVITIFPGGSRFDRHSACLCGCVCVCACVVRFLCGPWLLLVASVEVDLPLHSDTHTISVSGLSWSSSTALAFVPRRTVGGTTSCISLLSMRARGEHFPPPNANATSGITFLLPYRLIFFSESHANFFTHGESSWLP